MPDEVSKHSGTHLDFQVTDVADAARRIQEVGGTVVTPPDFYAPDGEAARPLG